MCEGNTIFATQILWGGSDPGPRGRYCFFQPFRRLGNIDAAVFNAYSRVFLFVQRLTMSTIQPNAATMPFEDLDEFLMSDKTLDDCMLISDLDGFLTGVVISPDLIMPSEWLPRIWGDGVPVFWETLDGQIIAGDWAEGFRDAIQLRPDQWMEILDDQETRNLVLPILSLTFAEDGSPFMDISDDVLREINDEAPSSIPAVVWAIDQVCKARRDDDENLSREDPRRFGKVGRNEPCPCGSGRKYKRCCGAN